jgi:deazaflavin-dependent oxidoreductase (nitroreductase family)
MFQKMAAWFENLILTWLTPLECPGPVWKWLFKIPLLFNRLGLDWTFGGRMPVLLLTTTGRKTGKLRLTPLEYLYEPELEAYRVTAGWGGKTDWYRNARTDPHVQVKLGRRSFAAIAEPVAQEEVAQFLIEATRLNPGALKIWQRWTPEPLDGSPEGLLRAAKYFPSLRLKPVKDGVQWDIPTKIA